MKGEIICPNPNCGFVGAPRRKSRGSTFAILSLILLGLIAGLVNLLLGGLVFLALVLYAVFYRGYRYYCPTCGMQVASDS